MHLQIKINEKLFISDPQETELGKSILKHSVLLIHRIGYENLTFKKLAIEAGTTEASVYRYFENKQRLLMYLVAWYWHWLYYQIGFTLNNLTNAEARLKAIIRLLAAPVKDDRSTNFINESILHQIVVEQGVKAYLTKQVTKDNQQQLFKPYKDLCKRIGDVMLEVNPGFKYPRALSITLIEMANLQKFFRQKLPSITDIAKGKNESNIIAFLDELVMSSVLGNKN